MLYLLFYVINYTHSIQVENFCKNFYLQIKAISIIHDANLNENRTEGLRDEVPGDQSLTPKNKESSFHLPLVLRIAKKE